MALNSKPSHTDAPLQGIKVLELASVLAGPLVGTFLAELGATVTKVEHPLQGDVTRSWRSKAESRVGPSAYYAAANGPKQILTLDLMSKAGKATLEAALEETDILLQNFKTASLVRLGVDPAKLANRHPRLIHLHLKGFMNNPDRGGYDMVVQAETGFMSLNAMPDSAPFRMPVALMDILAAHQMRSGVLLALYEREKTGLGAYVETWLDASGFSALANRATEHLVAGQSPKPLGALHPQIAPYGETFQCRCGQLVVTAIGNDRQFSLLCKQLNLANLVTDKRFKTNALRVENRGVLFDLLAPGFSRFDASELADSAIQLGVPLGRLKSVEEALSSATGQAMTADFDIEGHSVRHVRQVAFQVHRNGNLTT